MGIEKGRGRGRNSKKDYIPSGNEKLEQIVKNKFTTYLIGTLAILEQSLGEVWGHDTPPEYVTEEQDEWYDKWLEARTAILDLGHDQMRAIKHEIEKCDINFKKYQYEFILKNPKDKEQDNG